MKNNLQVFENSEFGQVRTVIINDEPMFCLSDVCRVLELTSVSKVRERLLQKGVNSIPTPTNGGTQEMTFINESNLYKVIFQSRKPEAERFSDWVTTEVLPSIRKHGVYVTESTLDKILGNPEFGIRLLTSLKEEREKNKMLAQQNDVMKPKALFADAVSASDTSILVRDLAKMMRQNGVQIGERRLYTWMRENGYICKGSTMPTQKAMEMEMFEIVVRTIERGNGLPLETKTSKVTGKGQVYFVQKFLAT